MRFIDCSISSTFPGPVIAQSLFKPVLRAVSKICKAESTLSADQMEYLDLQYHSWIRHDTGLIERFEQVLELLRTLRNQGAYGAHCLLIVCPGLIPPEHLAECFSLFSCIPGLNEQVMMLESLRQQATQPAWPANEQLLYQPITL